MTRLALLSLLLGLVLGAPLHGQPPPPSDLLKEPGYLDFDQLGLAKLGESRLVVNLYGPTMRVMAELARGKDESFSSLVAKLKAIRAKLWQVAPTEADILRRGLTDAARRLERLGWQTAVEVRSAGGELSFIQIRTDGDQILGLAVFFVDTDGQAGAINIVGSVTPEEIGRLGRNFKIESLERFEKK